MDELLQEFIAETRETLAALAGEIVAWEAAPSDRARLDAIFRFVHTVKGSCGFLDLPRLARLSHAAEDALAAVRDSRRSADAALVNAVLAVVDRIGEIVEAIDAGTALDDSTDDLLIAALKEDARPAPAAAAEAPAVAVARAHSRSVRLSVDLLDRMMSGMSDMVLARNELARHLREGAPDPRLDAALERMSLTVADLRDTVTRTRMQRIEALFSALPRMVRDTAASLGKQVLLTIEGGDVELDRELIEVMRDPLVHIIRNAIDHGIEPPAVRRAAGKPEAGRLIVGARQSGNQIIVDVIDDGAGIDAERLVAKAIAAGGDAATLRALSPQAKLDLAFQPGLSSRDEVSAVSGRGVGMDVVKANVEQIGGRIELESRRGHGLSIAIHVPLTLSIVSVVTVGVADQRFALPRRGIEEIVPAGARDVRVDRVGASWVAVIRGRRLPLVGLADVLGLAAASTMPALLAIVTTRDGAFALGIDTVLDIEELVVKPAAPVVMASGVFAGQTLPDSGLPLLLLDAAGIVARAGLRFAACQMVAEEPQPEQQRVSALLFDDLDGHRRAVVLGAVDRVETVPATALQVSGGRLRLTTDGRIVSAIAIAKLPDRRDHAVLRLRDDRAELAYVIAEPLEIVDLPADVAASGTGCGGIALVGGEPVEILDAHRLFADAGGGTSARPTCRLAPDASGWMQSFLAPLLTGAGYRIAADGVADVVLALDESAPTVVADAPLIRLRRDLAADVPGTIYRYDRAALLDAVRAATGS